MTKYTALPTATAVSDAPLLGEEPDASSADLPLEARNNTKAWDDDFFDLEDSSEIVAVFDFDYALMEDFNTKVGFASLAAFCLYPPVFGLALLGCAPCFLRRNVEWSARSQHVALTRDGIRFVRDRRKTCWGLSCTDAGRSSKTVPYDKITDCDIEEPAGNTCLCIPNVLTTVNIDTASSGGPGNHKELKITGLKDPVGFKKLVWAMKRHNAANGGHGLGQQPIMAESMHRGDGGSEAGHRPSHGQEGESISLLLREIRDELRELRKSSGAVGTAGGAAATMEAATEMVNMVAASAAVNNGEGANDGGSSAPGIV